jgi:hypothetical protein
VDGATGLPLSGARVTISGEVEPGVSYTRSFTTDSSGAFTTTVYAGEYEVSTSYGSYRGLQESFNASYPTTSLTLTMVPLGGSLATPTTVSVWVLGAAAGGAVAAVILAAIVAGRPVAPKAQRALAPAKPRAQAPPKP